MFDGHVLKFSYHVIQHVDSIRTYHAIDKEGPVGDKLFKILHTMSRQKIFMAFIDFCAIAQAFHVTLTIMCKFIVVNYRTKTKLFKYFIIHSKS